MLQTDYDIKCCAAIGISLDAWLSIGQEDRPVLLAWSRLPDGRKMYDKLCAKAANLSIIVWVTLPPEGRAQCLAHARQERAITHAKLKRSTTATPAATGEVTDTPPADKQENILNSKRRWAKSHPENLRANQKRYRETHGPQIAEAKRIYRATRRVAPKELLRKVNTICLDTRTGFVLPLS